MKKSLRFEVFKRDKFTCQYCGAKAPDVILHADHIKPRCEGGDDTLLNLVAACENCNLGKGAKPLSDDTALIKVRSQMEILQERREQLEMMMEWHRSLSDMDEEMVNFCVSAWKDIAPGDVTPNENGRRLLKRWIKGFGISEVVESMNICSKYIVIRDEAATPDSWETAFRKIENVCKMRKLERNNPTLAQAYHLKNIYLSIMRRNRKHVSWKLQAEGLERIQQCQASGVSFEAIAAEINKMKTPDDITAMSF